MREEPVKELLRFLDIAAASVSETENHLQIAVDLGYIHPKAGELLRAQAVSIRRMLFRLMEHYARGPGAGEH
jgi:four helix bundle protein